MDGANHICNRKEPRYKISEGITLSCDALLDESDIRQGTVVDVSSKGMRILCGGRFEVGQNFTTELGAEKFEGIIRRIEPWVGGQSILGCQLINQIPAELLEEMATAGIVNRRNDDRVHWDQPAKLTWELQPNELDVEIRDYSVGGMRVYSSEPIPDNVRLRIRLESEDQEKFIVEAKAVWKLESDEGCQTGLRFTSRDAPDVIERIHLNNQAAPEVDDVLLIIRPAIGITIMVATVLILLAVELWSLRG